MCNQNTTLHQIKIDKIDKAIDPVGCKLYCLTDDEIAIVEASI